METLPEELIPSVLAHECGHIACRHCLYTTMGRFILSEAVSLLGLDGLAILPIQMAFSYWMRCSELSADRAAALCDGNADKVVETCLRFAGFDKDILGEINEIIKTAAGILGGGGGGRLTLAQGAGKNTEKMDEAIQTAIDLIKG